MSYKKLAVVNPDSPESIAQSVLPYDRDDNRAKYLSYRVSGFTTREAAKMAGISHQAVGTWRKDEVFIALEARLPELRKTLGLEYVALEFLRNYRMVLQRDFQIIKKSLTYPDGMSKHDMDYMLKIRAQYTPQQLQILESLLTGETKSDDELNFTDFILGLAKTAKEVKLESKSISISSGLVSHNSISGNGHDG